MQRVLKALDRRIPAASTASIAIATWDVYQYLFNPNVTDPIDTGRSIHILKVEAKTPKIVKTLAETRDQVANRIRQEKFQPRYQKYLRRLWKESQIEIRPNYEKYLIASPLKISSARMLGKPWEVC